MILASIVLEELEGIADEQWPLGAPKGSLMAPVETVRCPVY